MTSTSSATDALEHRIRRARIVPVIRTSNPEDARHLVARLLEAGLDTIELTTTIPGWESVASAVRRESSSVALGIGTIHSREDARRAVDAGADFCVSPRLVPDARGVLASAGIPLIEGGLTPSEVLEAADRGVAKLFPAHVGGPRYLASILAVARGARIMPTGGIALEQVHAWLDAGAIAVGVGGDLTAPGDIAARMRQALKT